MIIHNLHLADITPYSNNPRENDKAVKEVMKSIEEFGFKVPIIIDENYVIITGHTRLRAAEALGLETVPCIMADDLTEEQVKAFRLVDNKVSEYATWDFDKLEMEIEDLKGLDFEIEQFGFTVAEKPLKNDHCNWDSYVADVKTPTTQRGDIWQLGRHRLMCGDSTERKEIEKLMNGYKAKLVITDPPYNVGLGYDETPEQAAARSRRTDGLKIINDKMDNKAFRKFLFEAHCRMCENMLEGAAIYVFHAVMESYNFHGAFKESGLKLSQSLVWVKNSLAMGRQDYHWRHEPIMYGWKEGAGHNWFGNRDKDTVFDEGKINFTKARKPELVSAIKDLQERIYENSSVIYHDKPSVNEDHPTMKPIKLIGKLIFNSSEKGDLILDSFGGSGSTLIAAEQAERICYMMELDPVYCDVIIRRWEEFTGERAERING